MDTMVEFNREELQETEGQEPVEDATDDDTLEGVDEEELGEESREEDDDVEYGEIPPDTLFPVPYTNEYGDEEIIEVRYDEIIQAVNEVKSGALEKKNEFIRTAMPVIDRMMKSEVMRAIDHYVGLQYSDEQLYKFLPDILRRAAPAQEENVADPNDYLGVVKQAIQNELTPIKKQFESVAQQQARATVLKNNDEMLSNAFTRYDIDPNSLNRDELRVLQKTLQDMYPNTNFENIRLSQSQAYIIVNDAVPKMKGRIPGAKKPGAIQSAMKQAKAPTIIPGRETSGLKPKKPTLQPTKGASIDNRRDSWLNLINQ